MTQVISVFSGNGGMGKSFLSCNLAYGLRSMGKSCLLVELSFGSRADDVILGIKAHTHYTVGDIFSDTCSVSEAVTTDEEGLLPDFICAANYTSEPHLTDGLKRILSFAKGRYDFVIVDTGSSLDFVSVSAAKHSDTCIFITDTSFLSLRNTSLLKDRLGDLKKAYTVINSPRLIDDDGVYIEDVIDEVGASLIGIVPYDEFVPESLSKGDLIYKYNTYSGKATENICRRLLGEQVPDFVKRTKSSFFNKNKLAPK